MKKLLSCFLVVLCIVLSASAALAAAPQELHILVTTDTHASVPPETITVTNDSLYANARDKGNMYDEGAAIFASFLDEALESDAQYILICGDLTADGTLAEYEQMAQMLRTFEKESNKSVFVVPGNHEGHGADTSREVFKAVFHEFGFAEAIETDVETCSYTADLNADYRLLALDSVEWNECRDGIDKRLKSWIRTQAQAAQKDGKHLIAMMHHPLMEHFTLHDVVLREFVVRNWQSLSAFFADNGIQYVFTGHEHSSDIACYTSPSGNTIYDVLTTSLNFNPVAYRDVTFTDSGVRFALQKIERITHPELLPDGYGNAQYSALTGDLQAYAYGYFNKCIELILRDYLDPATLCRKLGTNSALIHSTLQSVLPRVEYAMFEQPLYGENSLTDYADRHGLTIPQSENGTLWEACTALAQVHYCGDEHVSAFDTQAQVVLKGLGTAAEYALRGIPADVRQKLFGTVADAFPKLSWDVPNIKDGACTVVTSLVAPIVEGVICDRDVPDNNVTLPAYGQIHTFCLSSLWQYFTFKMRDLFHALSRMLFGFIIK